MSEFCLRAGRRRGLLTSASVMGLALAMAALSAAPASAADRRFTASSNTFANFFPSGGFDGGVLAGDRAIYDQGTGASGVITPKSWGAIRYLPSYGGAGFYTPPLPANVLTLMGLVDTDGVMRGIDDQVDQEITLNDRIALGASQEWRINSANGRIRQLNTAATRLVNLDAFTLTLNAVNAANRFQFDNPISGTGGLEIKGAGTTILNAANTYSGGTLLSGGVLSVSSDANLGDVAGGLTFNGGTLQVGTAYTSTARAIALNSSGGVFDIADPAANFTLNQIVDGAGALTKRGAGKLTLAAANTYSGATVIEAGVLALSGSGAIADSARVQADGTFDIAATTAGASIKSLSGSGLVELGGKTLGITDAADTFGGVIQGTGGLTLWGGTQVLTGAVSAFGALTINGDAALRIESGAQVTSSGQTNLSGTSDLVVNGPGSLLTIDILWLGNSANASPAAVRVENGGMLHIAGGSTSYLGHATGAQASLTVTGAGSQLDIDDTLAVGSYTSTTKGHLTIADGATATIASLQVGNISAPSSTPSTVEITGAGSSLGLAGRLDLFKGDLRVLDGATVTTSQLRLGSAGTGNVLISGAGSSVTTPGAVIFGSTVGGLGFLTLADGGALNAGGLVTLATNAGGTGVLNIGGAEGQTATAAGTFNAASLTFGPGTGRLNFNHTDPGYVFAAAISGAGQVNQVAGTTILTGANTYSGGTTISGGTLQLGDGGATGSIVGNVTNNGTLAFNRSDTITFGGVISGVGAVTQTGSGITVLTGANTYSGGTTITGGVLSVANDGVLGSAAGMVTLNGGTLQANGASAVTTHTYSLGVNGGGFDIANAGTSFGVLNGLTSGGPLTKLGAGSLTLAGDNSYAGGTTILEGELRIGNGGAAGSILGDVLNNGTLTFNRSTAYTYGGSITGSGGLTVSSVGVLTLTGDSSYDGPTTINGLNGGLLVNGGNTVASRGSTTLGRSTLTVDGVNSVFSTAALGGTAASGGRNIVTVSNGGTLRVTTGDVTLRAVPNPSASAQLDITGANSLADVAGGILGAVTANTTFSTTISAGGTLRTGGASQIGNASSSNALTAAITGAGSNWTSASSLFMTAGSFSLDQGGAASFSNATFGSTSVQAATVTVSGAGSRLTTTTGDLVIGSGVGTGAFTLKDGGSADVAGVLVLADGATATGILNIGGAEGQAAVGAGLLDAASLDFGSGTARLNFNHVETNYAFDTTISGLGAINQVAGVTNLTGNSAGFTGVTTVSGGVLRVNGVLGDASSSVLVQAGGRLGGGGTIGGDVTVDGALAPGNSPGVLTIAGDLTLNSGASLDYEFGQPNVPGGPYNDLIKVGGDLTLDGVIDVTVTPGGDFGLGLYRVIQYGGTLTDNVLNVGATPPGSGTVVQTSVGGQVNLVNSAGAALNFWDGPATGFNSHLEGGTGVWQQGGAQAWSEQTGAINDTYANGSFAIFAGTSGTVTIDDVPGAVSASGLQFASDGYKIDGDALNLVGPTSTIRVGDGTLDGAGYTATIDSVLTGAAQLVKTDLGALILNGDNTYTGGAEVKAGTLFINGDQTAATGPTHVASGATLGGDGVIGGDVTVADGATLAPGMSGVGTLTIAGDLTLSSGSALNFEFGEAGVAGGPHNDLVNVGNNLTLDGTLNITVSGGGSFDAGVYRVFNYSGGLTDHGLSIGTAPSGSSLSVQNSVLGQVNLVNSAGLNLNFWDGGPGPKLNDVIEGGDGVWHLGGADFNWTEQTGAVNATYADAALAIFAGTAGTVSVDNAGGAVTASGLQFATDGYVIKGDALTLTGGNAVIRVGDFSAAGAGYTATIEAALNGDGDFQKVDLGTLVLKGSNTFVGDLYVEAGELRLSDGGVIHSDEGFIGGDLNGPSTATVTGHGSTWTTASVLGIGNNGAAGVLNITDGGKVVSDLGYVGYDVHGEALVSGADSSWENTGTLSVGAFGTGGLRVEASAEVSGTDVIIGGADQGEAVVTGAGSTLAAAAQLTVGSFGIGALRIEDGATVTSDQGYVGADAVGSVVVTGAGSNWWVKTYSLTVGNNGIGSLAIEDGARVRAEGGVFLGSSVGSSGTLLLQGGAAGPAILETTGFQGDLGDAIVTLDDGLLRALDDNSTFFDGFGAHDVTLGAGGAVVDTNGHDIGVDPRLVGGGALTKDGVGTLTLTGANTYIGGTTITTGVLQLGDGGVSGSIIGDVANQGALAFNRSDVVTFGGVVSGAGALEQRGGGTTILTAANTYTGGTTITAGTLQLGDGGVTGSILGDVVNNGVLALDRSDDIAFDGAVSGGGALEHRSAGMLTLTADNTYTGGSAIIGGGTLRLGDGGLTGSILGDVANDGVLAFNRSNAITFGGVISGGGALEQIGSGVTLLAGANTYAGATTVNAGTLLVNGDQSAATGLTSVAAGATLGGLGVIGGDVVVADNGALNPGGDTGAPGALTIKGDLTLGGASSLNYNFGQANVVGGPLNDLIKVAGDLALNGAIDVVISPGGSFAPGLYRVISYDGNRTGGGLTIHSAPSGDYHVQTAIDHQVNLVNTAGLTLNYWDGGAGAKNSASLEGGDGVWHAAGTDDNWTTAAGDVNAAYDNGAFAVFAAAPGGVTLDSTQGDVHVAGMQFAVDGYVVQGAPLFLDGAGTIRVGDGTADGAGYTATLESALTGAGGFAKADLGTLILAGTNTYAGATNVDMGRLEVNGDQTGATGLTTVNAQGVLAGTGVIGGDVRVVDGAIAPGTSAATGTLTIEGNLVLNGGSTLNYRLGEAGVVGGLLNDLLKIDGDLTLDGTLNVAASVGGTYGPGLYRLIDYTGALRNDGLTLGVTPGGAPHRVQVAIAGQVNLVDDIPGGPTDPTDPIDPGGPAGPADPGGPTSPVNFWDGPSGVAADGVITGGDGVWQADGPNTWAQSDGAMNGAFESGIFAIFAGTSGTVKVDDGPGPVTVAGMQFASDGYKVTGDAVALAAGDAVVRVGDGSAEGAGFRATIASELTGVGRLDKTDMGTLILTGANTYIGGTKVSSGMLQLGDGGTSGAIQGDVAVSGALVFNRSDTTSFAGAISGDGVVGQIGSGVTALTGDSAAFAGRVVVQAGTLQVDRVLGGSTEVLGGGRLTGVGQVGPTGNRGIIAPGHDGLGTLTVAGAYVGQGGGLEIETQLGGDASPTDRLVIAGAASGVTPVKVTNLGGLGARTQQGIRVVQVDGALSGQFVLANGAYAIAGQSAVVAGAYGYVLQQDKADGDWYLRSSLPDSEGADRPLYQPGVPVYEAYANTLLSLSGVSTLRQRVGDRRYDPADAGRNGVWARMEGQTSHLEPSVSASGVHQDIDSGKTQFGIDRNLSETQGARLVGTLTAHFGTADTKLSSAYGGGDIDTKTYGVGAALTWYGQQGAYVDTQAQASWFDSDLRSSLAARLEDGQNGHGYGLSVEAGKAFAVKGGLSVTPQAQLSYASTAFDAFHDPFGADVDGDNSKSLQGRLGLALDHARSWRDAAGQTRTLSLYGLVNAKYEFLDGARVRVSGTPLDSRQGRTWGGLGAGGTYSWGEGRYAVYGEAAADTDLSSFGDSYTVTGTAGFRVRF